MIELVLPENNLCGQPQVARFHKVSALIGENGAGKSSILESIFNKRLKTGDFHGKKIVCFSSGQNEKYSAYFSEYLASERRANRGLNLGCCYYDKSWSRLLIFLATMERAGRVRGFLASKGYIDQTEDEREDISTKLEGAVKVDRPYVNRVQDALKQEADGNEDTFRRSAYHRTLESFVSSVVDADYDFEAPLDSRRVVLSNDNFFLLAVEEQGGSYFNGKTTFFTQAADNNYFFDRDSMSLRFKNGLELGDLSDGEYQILFLYALLDLFDSEHTLFLLDEVDSHLHYKNVDRLWDSLHSIGGMAITTTHLIDSITAPQNTFDSMKVITGGKIDDAEKPKAIIGRLSNLSRIESAQFMVCAKLENIVLMDDYNDWTIFLLLAERLGLDVSKLSSISVVKKTAGYCDVSQAFAKAKFDWVRSLLQIEEASRKTKNIFLICDRDEARITFRQDGVSVAGDAFEEEIKNIRGRNQRLGLSLLAWSRREVKNYLVSFTALSARGLLDSLHSEVLEKHYLQQDDPADGNTAIASLCVKSVITQIIDTPGIGLDKQKLTSYVNEIPPSEISGDIKNMYYFIVRKISGKV
uniref:AAA family ATPase n=1 Tax=Cellvibrio fontiphilus TaxID=1815559 RepID=UPI002B4BECAA|nr:AAA family ATPase [Cellvibrio fontiphilus]